MELSAPITGRWELKSVFICVDFPNINSSNNTIPFTENGVTKTAVLQPGYYDDVKLCEEVAKAMTNVSGGLNTYTASLNPITQKVTIQASNSPFTLDWGSRSSNSLAPILGFSSIDTPSSLSATGTRIVTLNPTLSFNITIDGVGEIQNVNGVVSAFYVPMDSELGPLDWHLFEPKQFIQHVVFRVPTKTLRIRVVDDHGKLLDLQQDWQMVIGSFDH